MYLGEESGRLCLPFALCRFQSCQFFFAKMKLRFAKWTACWALILRPVSNVVFSISSAAVEPLSFVRGSGDYWQWAWASKTRMGRSAAATTHAIAIGSCFSCRCRPLCGDVVRYSVPKEGVRALFSRDLGIASARPSVGRRQQACRKCDNFYFAATFLQCCWRHWRHCRFSKQRATTVTSLAVVRFFLSFFLSSALVVMRACWLLCY